MNPDFPQNEREQMEAELTALLLGELRADEAAALNAAMEADPELAALYERLKFTIELVREGAANPASQEAGQLAPLKLSGEKRGKLLASFKTVTPAAFVKPRRVPDWLAPLAAAAVIAVIFGCLAIPNFIKSRETSKKNLIVNNLRLLDGAKQLWALENNKSPDAEPTMSDLGPYLGRGSDAKIGSVAGETYVPGKIMELPKVETSVSQAKKLFGREMVAQGEARSGKVIVSPLIAVAPQRVVEVSRRQSRFGPIGPQPPTTTPVSAPQIVLPGQTLDGGVALSQLPTLGANSGPVPIRYALSSDVSSALKQLGNTNSPAFAAHSWSASTLGSTTVAGAATYFNYKEVTNSIADTGGKVPLLGDVPVVGSLFRTESQLADKNGDFKTALTRDDVSGLRYSVTNAVVADNNATHVHGIIEGKHRAEIVLPSMTDAGGGIDRYPGNQPGSMPDSAALEGSKEAREKDIQISQLVQDGKLMYQTGKTDGAEVKMNEALARDPGNQAALYYLSLLHQNRDRQLVDSRNVTSMNRMVSVENGSSNSWQAKPATVRGDYDDASDSATVAATKTAPYFAAKEALEEAKRWRQVLATKTGQEVVDVNLPRAQTVSVVNPATAAPAEKPSLGEKIKSAFSGKVERTASIQVDQERPDIAGVGAPGNRVISYDPYFLLTEFETIKSDAVLKKAVESLKLDGGDPSKTEDAVKQLRKNLDLGSVKNMKVITIGAKSEKAEDAARVANAVAEAYKDFRSEEYDELTAHGIQSLQEQLVEQDQKIANLQSNVDKLRVDLRVPDSMANMTGAEPLMTVERLRELSSLKVSKEAEYNEQAKLLNELRKMDHGQLRNALSVAYHDAELDQLTQELDRAAQNLIKLRLDYNPDHPKYKAAQAVVADLNHKVDERVEGIMIGLQAKVASAKAFVDTITTEIKDGQQDSGDPAYLAAKEKLRQLLTQNDTALPKPAVPPPTPQPEILTRENAFSTFSLNVSDVSFKLAAASLEKGQMPEPGSIRSEEFINAFDYRDPEAGPGVPIAFASERARYPFAQNRELLRFSLKTAAAGRQAGRPLNIVLLLDNSGSMERADRVRIIQEAMRVLAAQLQASDTFSIVTFARTARLRVDGIPGNQAAAAAAEIAKLTPEGGTNLGDALDLAYETALHHYLANGDNRVVLLTDGAANLGDVQPDVLKQKVEAHRKQGVALDCFGIGWEGYNDDLLEVLTRHGDGRYGFINTPEEASTEFVSQIAGALHVAAADVKVQVEFNPKRVTSYRQIGYAKHQLTKEQFRDNTVDAAEIAAQEAGNALYTIETNPGGEGSIATVRVRYKATRTAEYREQSWDVPYTGGAVALDQASPAMRLAATASAFSEWLATSPFAAEVSTDQLLKYLNGVPQVYGADTRPAKLEWMIRQARSISGK